MTPSRSGGLLVAGVASGVGKSTLVTGLCRWLARQGLRAAPFKAQTLALNSTVTADGRELARAQAAQAAAAGVEPDAAMNPLLLKPGAGNSVHPIVNGRPADAATAARLRAEPAQRRALALQALARLRERFDTVVCEGAGACVEPGVPDVSNTRLAAAAGLPVVLAASVEAGGAFAAVHGTLALLPPDERPQVAGVVLTKHHGTADDLTQAIRWLRDRTGLPTIGIVPWCDGLWPDGEDVTALGHLDAARPVDHAAAGRPLTVALVDLPHAANLTDADPLVAEPGVTVRRTAQAPDVAAADLVLLPGTRATVADLAWLRSRGLDRALAGRAARGAPIVGLCGGYQLLGTDLSDASGVEAPPGTRARGLGLLPVTTTFDRAKVVRRVSGTSPYLGGVAAGGYELRHGRPRVEAGSPLLRDRHGDAEGCADGAVLGTSWHGLFEHDALREAVLAWAAERAGRAHEPSGLRYAAVRDAWFERAGDLVECHLDLGAVRELLGRSGAPA